MTDTQPYQEATIEIGEVDFNKYGMLTFDGLVNNDYVKVELEDMTKILPVICGEFEYMDQDGLHNGTLDDFNNIHWQIKQKGTITERRVYLKPLIEQYLIEKYQKSR